MNQPKHSPAMVDDTPVKVSDFAEGLIIGMGLRRFVTKLMIWSRDGLMLYLDPDAAPGRIFRMEIGRKKGSCYYHVVSLTYQADSGTYCLAASKLPRQLRQLRGLLSPSSPATVSYEQALFSAYEMLAYLKRCG